MMALDGGRIGIASQAIGIATAALEEAVAYARERKQFGKPIAEFQAIQWMLADAATELDAARLLTLRAAHAQGGGPPLHARGVDGEALRERGGRTASATAALQIHGGYGYVRDFAAERHLRDVRVTPIYEGTSEIQRTVIARSVLG